ncbi:glycoside hydrolase family 30 protein [Butyrivibrio sp. XPD2006]|uniref:glycoside hydrolase family 30 protein n=1 Tax=Butyrivibrio sp. XPD2006 TaxID=1280668 RepID=UPI0003B629E0|nr:glycoside hydrolase family 30 beta sandwich domain-containing protein [Butyrivibrio sp. XPD2006]
MMKNITAIETHLAGGKYWSCTALEDAGPAGEMKALVVFPEEEETTIRGFGGAFTEAAAHTYSGLNKEARSRLISDIFGADGLRYNIGRIHMNSCDFALGNYTYIDEGDESLESFNIEHDEKEIIPMIKAAEKELGKPLVLMMAPWSPPPFMKTNGEMNHGGELKPEYRQLWADYFVRFIQEYKKRGLEISFTSIQNEPNATQTWDSCRYTAEQEADFAVDFLGPALEKAGMLEDTRILVWDHNKEVSYKRFKDIMSKDGADKYIFGCAVHWYTGDHFENLGLIRKHFPAKEIFFTEGCVEYSRFAGEGDIHNAEMYAHQMLGNLKNGITAIFDWNLMVDYQGGPNHVGNYCDAPIKANEAGDDYEKKLSYYYIGHFSRYIKEGAKLIWTSCYTDRIKSVGFVNPDGERVLILLSESDVDTAVTVAEGESSAKLIVKAHSIQTLTYYK